ncbi:MAG: caspase family protein [Rhodoplanes sp.]
MRTAKFAGVLALAIVSASMLSAEVMRKAVGRQIAPGTQTRAAADPGVPDETRVAALAETGRAATAPQDPQPARAASDPSRDGGPLVALVIGNAAYPDEEAPLVQPLNDARAMAAELRARGFDVELGENLTKQGMERALERFDAKITPGTTALLFYSGHGVQTGRESFLIPVNAQIWRPEDVRRDGVALEPLVAELNTRGAKRKLVIVDASRRNPFERRLRGFSSGLAPIAAPEGTLVLYGVAPGKVADDTQGPNSLLVNELIGQLRASGGSAEDIFNRTRVMVARASNGEQVPAVFSALVDDFFFAPSAGPPSKASPARQSRR